MNNLILTTRIHDLKDHHQFLYQIIIDNVDDFLVKLYLGK